MPKKRDGDQHELFGEGDYDLYGGNPPHQRHSATSAAAAEAVVPRINRQHRLLLDYLRNDPRGSSDDRMSRVLGMGLNTIRPRRRELQLWHIVEDSGRTELTATGHPAVIWVLTKGDK